MTNALFGGLPLDCCAPFAIRFFFTHTPGWGWQVGIEICTKDVSFACVWCLIIRYEFFVEFRWVGT